MNDGDLASLSCTVSKGDFPLEIVWNFKGNPILPGRSDIIISDTSKRVKQITIEAIAASHAGEYTCVVSNAAGSTSYSTVLEVNGIFFLSSEFSVLVF